MKKIGTALVCLALLAACQNNEKTQEQQHSEEHQHPSAVQAEGQPKEGEQKKPLSPTLNIQLASALNKTERLIGYD